jgi:hypothetical protein
MKTQSAAFVLLGVGYFALVSGMAVGAQDEPKGKESPDARFEKLLDAAMKAPEKANWRELREAFSRTTHYQPYSIDVTQKLEEIAGSLGRGETKESEAALLKLIEQERFMRIDTLAMLVRLYEKSGEPEKAERYKKVMDGILGVLKYPDEGTSFDKPIHVLFIQEEYLVATNLPIKKQALVIKNGHQYDVLELKTEGDESGKKIYFNVDLTRNARPVFDLEAKPKP